MIYKGRNMNSNSEIKNKLSIKKKIIYFMLMLIITIIIAFLAGELFIRIFYPQEDAMKWFKSDNRYGYVMKKNFYQEYHYPGYDFVMEVKTNSLGFRDKEYDLSEKDVKKILLLGDSFVFGHGINMEDHFATRLEGLLHQSSENFMVINAGVGGWGTLQEITYAKDNFDLFSPDIIVITFSGNDPQNDFGFKYKMRDQEKGIFNFPGKIFLRNNSHLYRFIHKKYSILLHNMVLKKKIAKSRKANEIYVLDKQSASIITEDQWNITLGYIENFHMEFISFNPNGILLVQAANPVNSDIRKNLSSVSNGKNLIYVDLFNDVYLLRPEERELPYDNHWSQIMHSISAENLYKTILSLNGNAKN
jgi:hypothetical protein